MTLPFPFPLTRHSAPERWSILILPPRERMTMTMTALWGTSGRPGNTRRLFCTLLAIVAPSLADGQQQYTLRSVGNCDGTGFIDNINECNAAARTLGGADAVTALAGDEVNNRQNCNRFPYGCATIGLVLL